MRCVLFTCIFVQVRKENRLVEQKCFFVVTFFCWLLPASELRLRCDLDVTSSGLGNSSLGLGIASVEQTRSENREKLREFSCLLLLFVG